MDTEAKPTLATCLKCWHAVEAGTLVQGLCVDCAPKKVKLPDVPKTKEAPAKTSARRKKTK